MNAGIPAVRNFSSKSIQGYKSITGISVILLFAMLIFAAMGQKKLKRFGEIKTFSNVLEYPEDIAGNWDGHFKNNHPVILELACGKGEYATGLALLKPENNYIGVDIKGNRIWVGAKFALENKLTNVAFLRTQIHQINSYFEKGEVKEISAIKCPILQK